MLSRVARRLLNRISRLIDQRRAATGSMRRVRRELREAGVDPTPPLQLRQLLDGIERGRLLGTDPKTGHLVHVESRAGGTVALLIDAKNGSTVKIVAVSLAQDAERLTLSEALYLLYPVMK